MDLFEHGDVLLGRPTLEPAQARDGVIHPRVTGGWRFSHGPFGIKVLIFTPCTLLAGAAAAAGLAGAAAAAGFACVAGAPGLAGAAAAAGRWVFVGHLL